MQQVCKTFDGHRRHRPPLQCYSKRQDYRMRTFSTFIFLLAAAIIAPAADNWPHWRGPLHNGVSDETNLPLRWSASENIRWKLALPGRSGATPIVWGDRIFVNVTDRDRIELWWVNGIGGQVLWEHV